MGSKIATFASKCEQTPIFLQIIDKYQFMCHVQVLVRPNVVASAAEVKFGLHVCEWKKIG